MENETIQGSHNTQVSSSDTIASKNVEIQSDIDTIIGNLQDLMTNLGDTAESNNDVDVTLQESVESVESVLSADLHMIPLIAAGAVAGGSVLLIKKIKDLAKKKKIRKKYADVDQLKIQAANLEVKVIEARTKISDIEDSDKKSAAKEKIAEAQAKLENLEEKAKEIDEALNDILPDDSDYLAALRAETKIKVAKIKLDAKGLSDSQREKIESTVKSANSTLQRVEKESNEKIEKSNQTVEQTPIEKQIENLEKSKEQAEKQKEEADESEKEALDQAIEGIDKKIAQLKEIDTKESFRLEDAKYIYESRPQYISERFRSLLS